jgi:hypothetical protein
VTAQAALSAPPATTRSRQGGRVRAGILALSAVGATINCLDRTAPGIAAPTPGADLGINAVLTGAAFSAFSRK